MSHEWTNKVGRGGEVSQIGKGTKWKYFLNGPKPVFLKITIDRHFKIRMEIVLTSTFYLSTC